MSYVEDDEGNFELEDGIYLSGERFVQYLKNAIGH